MARDKKPAGKMGLSASARAFERAAGRLRDRFVLKLYVSGLTPRSRRAIDNLSKLCEQYLQGRYDLEIVDIFQQPALAKGEHIIAAPTLVKKLPLPLRRVIGDMSDAGRILVVLGVAEAGRDQK